MQALKTIIGDYDEFLASVLQRVAAKGFDLDDFVQIDHLCYRTTSIEQYAYKKREIATIAKLLGETKVNGRPIATFRLHQPVVHGRWRIDALELPAPKNGAPHQEGLEHIEFVLYDDLAAFLQKYQGQPFEMRAADRGINPEVGLQLGEYSVKFHLLSLPAVIYLERKFGIHQVKDEP